MQQVAIETLRTHYRIIFDGNGYSEEWVKEAGRRGLPNYRTTVQAYEGVKLYDLYVRSGVFTEREVDSRVNVALETYIKNKRIEAKALLKLIDGYIFLSGQKSIERARRTLDAALPDSSTQHIKKRLGELVRLVDEVLQGRDQVSAQLEIHDDDLMKEAKNIDEVINPLMVTVRKSCDELEGLVSDEDWSLPTYHEMLFLVS
jgi:glutamine synthetase